MEATLGPIQGLTLALLNKQLQRAELAASVDSRIATFMTRAFIAVSDPLTVELVTLIEAFMVWSDDSMVTSMFYFSRGLKFSSSIHIRQLTLPITLASGDLTYYYDLPGHLHSNVHTHTNSFQLCVCVCACCLMLKPGCDCLHHNQEAETK